MLLVQDIAGTLDPREIQRKPSPCPWLFVQGLRARSRRVIECDEVRSFIHPLLAARGIVVGRWNESSGPWQVLLTGRQAESLIYD